MRGIQGIHHVAVAVPDIDLARKFYVELLGFQEISAADWEPGNAWIDEIVGLKDSAGKSFIVRAPNAHIEVFQYLSPKPGPQEPDRPVNECGYTHFALQVDDIEAVYQRMVDAGIRFHTPPDPVPTDEHGNKCGFSATYGRDFFGNVFEILEIHAGSDIAPL
jgi:catechol 2,3-dioxygenase-like lactoylglutathione lyase family enzyme